jgi:hypothetical protein
MGPEPHIPYLNKDGASESGDYQSQMLHIKRRRILYLVVLFLGQVLAHFLVNDFLVVLIVHVNASIGNCIIHDLVSIVVKDR